MNIVTKALLIPYTFVWMNWAPVAGLYYFLRGRPLGVWNSISVKHLKQA
jgi:hypothetical protein